MVNLLLKYLNNFWTLGLPDWVHGNRPCPSVSLSVSPSLNISETAHWFFLIFCIKLGHHKGTKVTEPDIWKKSWGVTNGGKTPFSGHFWCFFPYLCIQSSSKLLCPGKIWFLLYSRDQTPIFESFWCFSHYVCSDAVIWRTWNLDRMYSVYSYLIIKKKYLLKIMLRGIN